MADRPDFELESAMAGVGTAAVTREPDPVKALEEAREALARANERLAVYEALEAASTALIWSTLPDGCPDYVSPRWTEYTGLTLDELRGRGLEYVNHAADFLRVLEVWNEALAAGGHCKAEFRYRRHDGEFRWFLGSVVPVMDEHGRVIRWVGTMTDIHDRKQQEQTNSELNATLRQRAAENARLRESLASRLDEFERLVETAPVAIFIADDPDCLHVRAANAVAREWFTPHVPDVATANLSAAMPPEQRPEHFRHFRDGVELTADDLPMQVAARTGRMVGPDQIDFLWEDGSVQHIYGYASPLTSKDGKVRGSIGAFLDVTARKEDELKIATLNEQLQRSMRETHHRVKNSMQLVAALVDMMTQSGAESVPVCEVERLGQHIQALAAVHDLLTGQAKEIRDAQSLSVRAVFERLMPLLQSVVASRRSLSTDIEDAEITNRQATSLAMVAAELVSNAVKHGGQHVSIAFTAADRKGYLTVEDDGPGFPTGFDPKIAAHTGLELVTHLSAWDLGGGARFENREGGGARAVVTLLLSSSD